MGAIEDLLSQGRQAAGVFTDPSLAVGGRVIAAPGTYLDPMRSIQGLQPLPNEAPAGGAPAAPAMKKLPVQSITDVIGKAQEANAAMMRANEEASKEAPEVISKWNPATNQTTYEVKNLPQSDMQDVFQALQFTREAMKGYHQEFERLGQQEKQLSTGFGPIGNLLATLGGNLAVADPRLPPVVRALGMTSKQLNPTLEEVRTRKLGVASEMADISQRQEGIYGAIETRKAAVEQRQEAQDLRVRTQEERERQNSIENERKAEKAKLDEGNKLLTRANLTAKEGEELTEKQVAALGKTLGITDPDVIAAATEAHQGQARRMRAAQEYTQGNAKEMAAYKADLARENQNHAYLLRDQLAENAHDRKVSDMKLAEGLKRSRALEMVPTANLKVLASANTTEAFLNSVEDLVNNPTYEKFAGLSSAINRPIPAWLKSADRVKFESHLAHELPRILQIIGSGQQGGFSLLRSDDGKKLVARLGVMPQMTTQQQREVLGILRGIVKDQRQGIVAATPRASWGEYNKLLGRDFDYLMKYIGQSVPAPGGGGSQFPQFTPGGAAPAAAAPGAPPENLDNAFAAWQQQQRR